jgi:putative alpha-1,2-mannosidase
MVEKSFLDIPIIDEDVFSIIAKNVSENNIFIQSATMNGLPHTKNYTIQHDLNKGGALEFMIGNKPNRQWSSNLEDCPPDLMK